MLRRVGYVIVLAAMLSAGIWSCVFAADAGIKGYGEIALPYNRAGAFDINVAISGNVLSGGFRYKEYSTSATAVNAGSIIYSQSVSSLQVTDNYAVVKAVGYWNGALSDITVEAKDLGQGNDWFHITAVPRGMLTVLYDASGYLTSGSGDIVITGGTTPTGYAKGAGTISIGKTLGTFKFSSEFTNSGVNGYAYYVEAFSTAVTARGIVRIYLPAVQKMEITGASAVIEGKGTLNGRTAYITIKVTDTSRLAIPVAIPDWFEITANPTTTDSVSAAYHAEGRITSGDIVVVSK